MFCIKRFKDIKKPYDCEIVTPMFLGGANPMRAELRVPPFKGALRFWWRALNPQEIRRLAEKEASIFGDAGDSAGQSSIKLMILDENITHGKAQPLPHHNSPPKNFQIECITSGTFKIHFYGEEKDYKLFEISCFLGGLGKRSRRGFGSVRITNPSQNDSKSPINYIYGLIDALQPGKFKITSNEITRTDSLSGVNYAYLKKIMIGKEEDNVHNLLKRIGQATHAYKCDFLGFAKGQERFASPVYVTVNKREDGRFYPVVSLLNSAPKNPLSGPDNTKEFIQKVLG